MSGQLAKTHMDSSAVTLEHRGYYVPFQILPTTIATLLQFPTQPLPNLTRPSLGWGL